MDENTEEQQEKKGFFEWFRSLFGGNEEEEEVQNAPHYKRKLLDGRIEKYLDQNMNAYIQEYGILTGLDIEAYELRYSSLTSRISTVREYMLEADARISAMEKEIAQVKTVSKKKSG
ncbi:MAG: hypothetical protein JXA22_05635 [Candidatus Thermoplasmatota archaeon]|nr:hypothetical protein [Candidatus Thermoplasmatota archaeon]